MSQYLCLVCFVCLFIYPFCCHAVTPHDYILAIEGEIQPREILLRKYFNLGFSYMEILAFLSKFHGIVLSLRQLKCLLRAIRLRRRTESNSIPEVAQAIERELEGSASSLGYRAMHQRLQIGHGLVASRETVRQILKIVDPEGIERRSRHRLKRRQYKAKGPNYLWHIDGYDKLKPFGFGIHGAIDGHSCLILWLDVGPSNNDPRIIAQYFLNYVRQICGAPCIVCADCGTENVHVAAIF